MKHRRKRKLSIPKRKTVLFFASLIVFFGFLGIGAWFIFGFSHSRVVSPLPQGVFRIAAKSTKQKEKAIETYLVKHHFVIDEIKRSSDSAIIVLLKDNGEVYLSEDNYVEELPSLQRIISQLTMEGKRFKRLDLRFERPIIVL